MSQPKSLSMTVQNLKRRKKKIASDCKWYLMTTNKQWPILYFKCNFPHTTITRISMNDYNKRPTDF